MEWDVQHVAETESTNADVATAAREGAPEGTVIVADHQTAGRGRLDRTWEAPAGSGLVMSALVRPDELDPARWPWIPLMTGVAIADAVRDAGLEPGVKWPNDVEIGGRKLAGILVERVETADGPAAVIGIGLNVAMTSDQLPVPTATSLNLEGSAATRDDVLAAVLACLATRYELLRTDPAALRDVYLAVCSTVGSTVRVSLPDDMTVKGAATDVDEHGRLVVDGRPITAGDVVHVRS
jgi:BirA family transcriptional regulator, biotin operon repressor / biotin---[acetyl-CoA-carboxylase] ligase